MNSIREQWLLIFSTPVYLIIIGFEILLSHIQHKKIYTLKDTFTNVFLMLSNSVIDIGFRIISVTVLFFFYNHTNIHITHIGFYWLSLLLLEDFMYYWLHRFDHTVRIFWAVHVTHHSSELMNFTVGFRSSVFQPLYRFIYFIPLAFFGFHPMDIAFIYSATQIWGIFVHTEYIHKMGILEYFMVTPSHHRVHHGSNPKYLDKNMGMFLIIWDKIFGTFQEELPKESYETIKYGLTKNLETSNLISIIFHEWHQIFTDISDNNLTLPQKLKYLFGPPGWSHDGSRQTSEQLRIKENNCLTLNNNASDSKINHQEDLLFL